MIPLHYFSFVHNIIIIHNDSALISSVHFAFKFNWQFIWHHPVQQDIEITRCVFPGTSYVQGVNEVLNSSQYLTVWIKQKWLIGKARKQTD